MLSSTIAATHLVVSPSSFPNSFPPAFPLSLCVFNSRTVTRQQCLVPMSLVPVKENGGSLFLGFSGRKRGYSNAGLYFGCFGFLRKCKDWDSEGDFTLEDEILEFMKSSKKPEAFPTKKELIEAGRVDLVDAIARKGGWLSLGWNLEEESSNFSPWDSTMAEECDCSGSSGNQIVLSGVVSSLPDDSSQAVSSSDRSLEAATTEHDTGIEGILNRLEKQRNLMLSFSLRDKEDKTFFPNSDDKYDWSPKTSADTAVSGLFRSSRPASVNPTKTILNDSRDRPNQNGSLLSDIDVQQKSPSPETWRTWSTQRAGFSIQDFEAAEISYDRTGQSEDVPRDKTFPLREGANELERRIELGCHQKEINHKEISSRIKHLESELSSALCSLRSKADEAALRSVLLYKMGHDSSSEDLRKLSDTSEFQETEIMRTWDKLRSTRAKLAVLEGKMAMASIDAQKILEEKQKRINNANKALQLLRSELITWAKSGSEVLVAGSYDGWTTQRKMEKSNSGLFSLWLKLYPGRYEIKFIVDGKWRIDPLRPIVENNGHKNNVLIIM